MNYYFLQENLDADGYYVEDYESNLKGIREELLEGETLSNQIEYIKAYCDLSDGKTTDLLDTVVFIVSEKLKNKLLQLDNNLEIFPVKVLGKKGKELSDYYVINILNTLDAIDMNKSQFSYDNEFDVFDKIEKLVLDVDKVNHRNIFREENILSQIIVSEKVKNELEAFEDLTFIPVEDYEYPV